MKIAIVVNSAWAAYNFRSNLASSFESLGHKVTFIVPFDGEYSDKLKKNFKCKNYYLNAGGLNPFQDIKTLLSLINVFKSLKPDIICNFTIKPNIYGSIAAKINTIPSICNITGLGTVFIRRNIFTLFVGLLYRVALSFSNLVYFQNIQDQDFFVSNKFIKQAKTQLLPGSGVDLTRFKPSNLTSKTDVFVFLLISRVIKDKGVYEFIEAIRRVKRDFPNVQLEFQILGEVEVENRTVIQKSELEKWIEDGLVNYLGVTNEVEKVIAKCDCVVLPSYREGMPRSVLEAFAMEKPVIVSNVPGCVDIVDHKVNGLICKVKSHKDLADKMITMFSMSQTLRNEMALNGRTKVENFFDENIVINQYIESIQAVVSNEKTV
jgi:glycosyltransferase involved in cell wall biosynthesis